MFGESDKLLPDMEGQGSALMWHDWRIIAELYQKWKVKQQGGTEGEGGTLGDDVGELKEDGEYQMPPPLKGTHRFKDLGGGGEET